MKSRKPLLSLVAASSLIFAGSLLAQNAPMPPPPPSPANATPMPPVPPPAPAAPQPGTLIPPPDAPPAPPAPPSAPAPSVPTAPTAEQAAYQTPQGELTVRSAPAPAPQIGPAPDFTQLSAGGNSISEQQAVAYPALANDFIHADSNRNGSISKTEYQHWTEQP